MLLFETAVLAPVNSLKNSPPKPVLVGVDGCSAIAPELPRECPAQGSQRHEGMQYEMRCFRIVE